VGARQSAGAHPFCQPAVAGWAGGAVRPRVSSVDRARTGRQPGWLVPRHRQPLPCHPTAAEEAAALADPGDLRLISPARVSQRRGRYPLLRAARPCPSMALAVCAPVSRLHPFRAASLPVGDHSPMGVLGLLGGTAFGGILDWRAWRAWERPRWSRRAAHAGRRCARRTRAADPGSWPPTTPPQRETCRQRPSPPSRPGRDARRRCRTGGRSDAGPDSRPGAATSESAGHRRSPLPASTRSSHRSRGWSSAAARSRRPARARR
jgi:hypothetical protein